MNFEAFLIDVLTPILDCPEALRVEVKGEGRKVDVLIYADPKDRGRIIGKSGRMITSLRTLVQVAGEKAGARVNLELFDGDTIPAATPGVAIAEALGDAPVDAPEAP